VSRVSHPVDSTTGELAALSPLVYATTMQQLTESMAALVTHSVSVRVKHENITVATAASAAVPAALSQQVQRTSVIDPACVVGHHKRSRATDLAWGRLLKEIRHWRWTEHAVEEVVNGHMASMGDSLDGPQLWPGATLRFIASTNSGCAGAAALATLDDIGDSVRDPLPRVGGGDGDDGDRAAAVDAVEFIRRYVHRVDVAAVAGTPGSVVLVARPAAERRSPTCLRRTTSSCRMSFPHHVVYTGDDLGP
jgi:hypothetical protein